MPLLSFVSPLAVTWLLKGYGVAADYWFMVGLMSVNLLLLPFLRNPPLGNVEEPPRLSPGWDDMKLIAGAPVFWALGPRDYLQNAASAGPRSRLRGDAR